MSEKLKLPEAFSDALIVLASGLGLTMDPPVFIGCILLASSGAVIGRGFTPIAVGRKAFGLTLSSGLLFALMAVLLNQALYSGGLIPPISPQLVAILGGLLGPLALPLLLRLFPSLAERIFDHYIPPKKQVPK